MCAFFIPLKLDRRKRSIIYGIIDKISFLLIVALINESLINSEGLIKLHPNLNVLIYMRL